MDEDFKAIVAHELGAAGAHALYALGVHQRRCWRSILLLGCCRTCETLEREFLLKLREFTEGVRRVILE